MRSKAFFGSILLSFFICGMLGAIPMATFTNNFADKEVAMEENKVSRGNEENEDIPQASAAKWTFMVYLDADNNLEAAGIDDLNEMEKIGSTSDVNIVVQIDRVSGYDSTNGGWTSTKRYLVQKDNDQSTIGTAPISDIGEANMGDQATLTNFITWAQSNYPADNYALILWDHGSGAMYGPYEGGVCWDDTNGHDYLTDDEIANAISGKGIGLLGMDACLMAATDFWYGLKDYVSVLVGSEKTEPGDGWPYDTILQYLTATPTATPSQLGSQIVQKYVASYPTYEPVTQSAVSATSLTTIQTSTSALAAAIAANMDSTNQTYLAALRAGLYEYDGEPYVDLYQFAEAVLNSATLTAYDTLAQNVIDAITAGVIQNGYRTTELANSHGLTVYFPATPAGFSSNYQSNPWSTAGSWDEMLISFYTASPSAGNDDVYEENDDFGTAAPLLPSTYPGLIWNDDDFYKVNVYANENITVSMQYTHSAGDLDLYLFDGSQTQVDFSNLETGYEEVYWEVPSNQIVYIYIFNYTGESDMEYDLMIEIEAEDDIYEENDIKEDAVLISGGQLNSTIEDLKAFDTDWYYFDEPLYEDVLCWVLLGYQAAEGIISMNIYGFDDPFWDLLASVGSPNDNEEFYFSPWQIENSFGYDYTAYYIEVINYERNANYSLTVGYDIYYDDAYDDNNDAMISAPTLIDGWHTDLICIDEDLYKVSLAANQWVYIELDFVNGEGDIDLYLYNAAGDEQLAQSFYWSDGEFIKYKTTTAGTYLIQVFPYEINLNYSIFVNSSTSQVFATDQFDTTSHDPNTAPDLEVNTQYEDLTAWQDDYFWVELMAGRELEIILSYDAEETTLILVLYAIDGYDLVPIAMSYSTEPLEIISGVLSESNDYLIQILVIQGVESYDLIINQDQSEDDDADDDDEEDGIPGYHAGLLLGISLLSVYGLLRRKRKEN